MRSLGMIFFFLLLSLLWPTTEGLKETQKERRNNERDLYNELLLLRTISEDRKKETACKIGGHFHFSIQTTLPSSSSSSSSSSSNNTKKTDFELFSGILGGIVQSFQVEEFHLSFTSGRWNSEVYGQPFVPAPHGVEFYATFSKQNSQKKYDELWKKFSEALSGLFCASFTSIPLTTTSPTFGFFSALDGNPLDKANRTRYGTMLSEPVCTENLTPWLMLLPSSRQTNGFTSLLSPQKIYNMAYHSLGVHFRTLEERERNREGFHGSGKRVEVAQTLSFLTHETRSQWSFRDLFGKTKGIVPSPMANTSFVVVETTTHPHALLSPPRAKESSFYAKYDLRSQEINKPFVMRIDLPEPKMRDALPPLHESKLLAVEMSGSGIGDETGGFITKFKNKDSVNGVVVQYFMLVPWYIQLYLHTLSFSFGPLSQPNNTYLPIEYSLSALQSKLPPHVPFTSALCEDNLNLREPALWNPAKRVDESDSVDELSPRRDFKNQQPSPFDVFQSREHGDLIWVRLHPAENRKRPAVIEFVAILPPSSSMIVTSEFDLALLYFYEYPPDAHRGFDVGAASVKYHFVPPPKHKKISETEHFWRLYQSELVSGVVSWPDCLYQNWSVCMKEGGGRYHQYTEMVRVSLPTPDFSMPYNVIVFTCTVLATFFGQILDLLIMHLKPLREGKEVTTKRIVDHMVTYFKTKFPRLQKREEK